jgi:hypothetical protein
VPFKGGAQAMPAVMSGEVASSFATIVSSLPLVASGKPRGLAVTSAKRFPSAKEFPTVAESGLPGNEAVAWYGVFAPTGTPPEIVAQLNADIVKVLDSPEVRDLLLKQGAGVERSLAAHCCGRPIDRINFEYLSISLRQCSVSSAGPLPTGTTARSFSRFAVSGLASPDTIALPSVSTAD